MALNPSAAADAYLRAFAISREAQHQKAQLALEARQQNAELQMRKQQVQASQVQAGLAAAERKRVVQQNAILAQQRAEQQKAYEDTRLQLEASRLEDAERIQAAKIQQAAQQADLKQSFAKDIASGVPMKDAVARHAALFTPGQVLNVPRETSLEERRKAAGEAANQRTDLERQRLTDYEAENQARNQRAQAAADAKAAAAANKGVPINQLQTAMDMASPDQKPALQAAIQEQIKRMTGQASGGAENATPKFKEGDTIQDKQGKIYKVTNGRPVLVKGAAGDNDQ
jgi:colicin import membrane protein